MSISSGVAVDRSAYGAGNSHRPFQSGQAILSRFVYQLAKQYARSRHYPVFINLNSSDLDFYNQAAIAVIVEQNITPTAQQKKGNFLLSAKPIASKTSSFVLATAKYFAGPPMAKVVCLTTARFV